MKLQFNIDYQTKFGEELVLNILPQQEGAPNEQHKMHTSDGEHWTCDINHKQAPQAAHITYFYTLLHRNEEVRREWQLVPHCLEFTAANAKSYTIYDHWLDIPEDAYLYSSAFTVDAGLKPSAPTTFPVTVRVKVRAPQLRANQRLAVVGGDDVLGDWDVARALPMTQHECHEWAISLDATKLSQQTELKFIAVNTDGDQQPMWESGMNRTLNLPVTQAGDVVVYELPQAYFPVFPWKGAGTVIPVFSLRTEGSFGVGDFGDLRRMVDWCTKTHQRVLQILPINDTNITGTWQDSYPYNSISIYALHPQYCDVRQLPAIKDEPTARRFELLRQELNALPQIDYERMFKAKMEYLRTVFAQEWGSVQRRDTFKQFFTQNEHWLVPYAAFCYYRDLYGTATFSAWPDTATVQNTQRPSFKGKKELQFWFYVQYLLDQQMRAAHDYARQNGVILKGDIPIGISRDGVEAWVEPRYFNLNGQAGAPPDAFSVNGQNWGFPTYNWDAMLSDDCSWWVRRFRKMAEYFDAYRIDHVLGFFRIWEIPIDAVHGLLGQFSPALAMTRQEIEAYGLPFRDDYLRPYIATWTLERIFGSRAAVVQQTFLDPTAGDRWQMKPAFDTQRKVLDWFTAEKAKPAYQQPEAMTALANLRDGLYALISDVLFVVDRKDANKYHPRIGVQNDFAYQVLSDGDKFNFNRLYNDYFYRRNNQFWYQEAMKKLPLLTQATRMLVCAEDLGMVPDCVPWVINQLRILSLEIQTMPKESRYRFARLSHNPYRSVDTISTHDMPTLRQWWDEDLAQTQEYYETMLHRGGPAPHPLPGWLAKDIVSRHLTSPSMLCLLSLQDWLSTDEQLRLPDANAERINIPANPRHYWRYRMHLTIEQLLAADDFNESVTTLIAQSGRQ